MPNLPPLEDEQPDDVPGSYARPPRKNAAGRQKASVNNDAYLEVSKLKRKATKAASATNIPEPEMALPADTFNEDLTRLTPTSSRLRAMRQSKNQVLDLSDVTPRPRPSRRLANDAADTNKPVPRSASIRQPQYEQVDSNITSVRSHSPRTPRQPQSEKSPTQKTSVRPRTPRSPRQPQYEQGDAGSTSTRLRAMRQTKDHALDLGTVPLRPRPARQPLNESLIRDLPSGPLQGPRQYAEDEVHEQIASIQPRAVRRPRADDAATLADSVPRVRGTRRLSADEGELDTLATPHATNKIMVAQRRRSPIYEPLPTAHHHARGHQQRQQHALFSHIQQLRRNPAFLIIVALFVVLLIFVPIISSMSGNSATRTINPETSSGSAPTNNTISNNNSSADPHQLVIIPPNNDHPAPPVYANAAYLLDADTGATLYASNPFMHLPMLSTTKLMTALLAAEHGNPDQNITITDAMQNDIDQLSADSALIHVKKGETYTLRDMLYGLLQVSGNDAAIVIADALAGNEQAFVDKMNQRAGQLGLHDTHYRNPHGLLMTGQFSSAHDLAILGKLSLSMPLVHEISSSKQYHLPQTDKHPEHTFVNGNQFLWWYPGVDGGKTGWDAATNFIQVISCVRNNHRLIGVTMHTIDWWTDMRDLMNWGFSSYTWVSPKDADNSHAMPFAADWNYFTKDKKENTVPISDQGRYYISSGFSISGSVMDYFDKNKGLEQFGFPIAKPQMSNDTLLKQRFEHGSIQCDLKTKQCKSG